jgi:hypothetical protein
MVQVYIRRGQPSMRAHLWLKQQSLEFTSCPDHFVRSSGDPDVRLFEVETSALAVELALRFA